jgi:hypothetical protein
MKARIALLLCLLLLGSVTADAASVAFRVGQYAPRGKSDLWFENEETFDFLVSDFNYPFGGVEFAIELNEFVDFAFGVDVYSRRVTTNYRDFVRDDGTEIIHDARLTVVPVTSGVRFLPLGKFHVVVPYVTGGLGLYPYEYREEGEFIDFATFDIFGAVFLDRGVGFGAYGAAGIEVSLTRGFLVFGEVRRHWVWTNHGGDFREFGDFDLDARQIAFGFTLRF